MSEMFKITFAPKMNHFKSDPLKKRSVDDLATMLMEPLNDKAYEFISGDVHRIVRLFVDIDCKGAKLFKDEETYDIYRTKIHDLFSDYAEENDFIMLTSSKYNYTSTTFKKVSGKSVPVLTPHMSNISVRLHSRTAACKYGAMGTIIKELYEEEIVKLLKGVNKRLMELTGKECHIDTGVYNKSDQKMRMYNVSKLNEDRPLVFDEYMTFDSEDDRRERIKETFLTNITEDLEIYDMEPTIPSFEKATKLTTKLKTTSSSSITKSADDAVVDTSGPAYGEPMEKIEELCAMLNPDKFISYSMWNKLAIKLKNVGSDLFPIFKKISAACPEKFDEWKCIAEWNKQTIFPDGKVIHLKGLHDWARKDSPEEHKVYFKKWNPINKVENVKRIYLSEEYTKMRTKLQTERHIFFSRATASFNEINEFDERVVYSERDFKNVFAQYEVEGHSFIDLWIKDPERNEFIKEAFIPGTNTDKRIYNLFRGFKYDNKSDEPMGTDKIQPILDSIKRLVRDDTAAYDSIMNWWAWIRQRPDRKTDQAIFLYSQTEGSGKSTVVEFMNKIFEGFTAEPLNLSNLTAKFNATFINKFLVNCNEIKTNSRNMADDLKNLITRKVMQGEMKNHDPKSIKDFMNLIMTANNKYSIKASKGMRRFNMINCIEERMPKEMSEELYGLMADDDAMYELDSFLKLMPLPDKLEDLENDFRKEAISYSAETYIKMIYEQPELFASPTPSDKATPEEISAWTPKYFTTENLFETAVNMDKAKGVEIGYSKRQLEIGFNAEFGEYKHPKNGYSFPKIDAFKIELRVKNPWLTCIA